MTKMSYSEQLKDPRWQKKRLQKLEAAGWHCESCQDGGSTLHVHHKRYAKGRMPWEYEDSELAVLCEGCHEVEHSRVEARTAFVAALPLDGPAGVDDFMASGAGSIALHSGQIGDGLKSKLADLASRNPHAFACGTLAGLVSLLGVDIPGALRLSSLCVGWDDRFAEEVIGLLKRHGVTFYGQASSDL